MQPTKQIYVIVFPYIINALNLVNKFRTGVTFAIQSISLSFTEHKLRDFKAEERNQKLFTCLLIQTGWTRFIYIKLFNKYSSS